MPSAVAGVTPGFLSATGLTMSLLKPVPFCRCSGWRFRFGTIAKAARAMNPAFAIGEKTAPGSVRRTLLQRKAPALLPGPRLRMLRIARWR
jgi:hypothetical protein